MRAIEFRISPSGVSVTWPDGQRGRADGAIAPDGKGVAELLAAAHARDQAPSVPAAHVVVADVLCWLDVVEGDFAAEGLRRAQRVAEACAQEVLGEEASQYQLRWTLQRDGQHLLLCAMPQRLIDAVAQAMAALGLGLASLQPAFVQAWNSAQRKLPGSEGVAVNLQGGQALVAHWRGGVITALARDRVDDADARACAADLERAARRLLARHGEDATALTHHVLLDDWPWPGETLAPWIQANPIARRPAPMRSARMLGTGSSAGTPPGVAGAV